MTIAHESPPRRSLGRLFAGAALILVGAAWLADRLDLFELRPAFVFPALLSVVGIALMVSSFEGRHPGLVVLGAVLAILTMVAAIGPVRWGSGIGERRLTVSTVQDLDAVYEHAVGSMELDLSALRPDGEVALDATVGVGELVIQVPREVVIDVRASSGLGEVVLFGERHDGFGVSESFRSDRFADSPDRLVIDLEVGLGKVEVRR